ncbi:MAG: SDR family oxidoreductase [Chlamydiota bacterium]|nr:SDR family oxidoreductase [Chlamydiota bacterium]
MKNIALITGASSGIGLELAKVHAKRGGDLILVARRKELLEDLKKELESKYGVTVLVISKDLAKVNAAKELYQEVKKQNLIVDYLINNAGFGGRGKFHERSWENDKDMINLNVLALVELTRLFLDDMVALNKGAILNVASMAGFVPGPLQAIYYATKAFVVSFTEAIANELSNTKVTATVLCPGPTDTEFFDVANMTGVRGLKRGRASAKDVAQLGYDQMKQGKTIAIPGLMNKGLLFATRILPRSLATKISRYMMEKA